MTAKRPDRHVRWTGCIDPGDDRADQAVRVIDDGVRNDFAPGGELERRDMNGLRAGNDAIAAPRPRLDTATVLTPVRRPQMDRCPTIQAIGRNPQDRRYPSIAFTARAMMGDREEDRERGLGLANEADRRRSAMVAAALMAAWGPGMPGAPDT